jgi:hypothetical protein
METIVITKKLFNNLNEIFNNSGQQVTAQQLINRRIYINGCGWSDIELTNELNEQIAEQIAESLGGRSATKQSIKNVLRYSKPQHWGLNRMLLNKYGNNNAYFSYCAGQDYSAETNAIRKALK